MTLANSFACCRAYSPASTAEQASLAQQPRQAGSTHLGMRVRAWHMGRGHAAVLRPADRLHGLGGVGCSCGGERSAGRSRHVQPQQWADPLARQFAAGRHAHTPHALHARTSTLAGRCRTFTRTVSQRFTDAVASERGQRNERQREHGPQRNSSGGPVAVWDPERQRGLQREQQRGAAHPDPHPAIWPPDIFPFGGGKRGTGILLGTSLCAPRLALVLLAQ